MKNMFILQNSRLAVCLGCILLVGTIFWPPPAGAQSVTREAVLRDIASKVLAPGYGDLALKCRELTNAVEHLAAAPGKKTLEAARKSWLATLQSAERMRCYQAGPIADREFVSTFYYWRIAPENIEAIIASPRAIDQPLLEEFGATAKGLFAMEYLLFNHKDNQTQGSGTLESFLGTNSLRRTSFLATVARDLEIKGSQLAKDWAASGKEGATARFVAGGQQSVNLLVNQLAAAVEYAAERRLDFVLALPQPISSQLNRLEASRSASSLQNLISFLQGIQNMYSGGEGLGLDDSIKLVNPLLEKRLKEQIEAVIAAIRAIDAPLEVAVIDKRASIKNAFEKTRVLEILFKVDLPSALGVTITFNSNDGD